MKSVKEIIRLVESWLSSDIYRIDSVVGWRGKAYRVVSIVAISIKRFVNDRVVDRAASLTYNTILAAVPILALFIAIGRGFGVQEALNNFVTKLFSDHQDVADTVMGFVDRYLAYTQQGTFLGVGIFVLLWAVIGILRKAESQFNIVWNVKRDRSIVNQITMYITIFIIVPIAIVIINSMVIVMGETLAKWLGFLMYGIMFTLIYFIVPNTNVKFKPALLSGLITGILFKALIQLYLFGQIWLSRYNAVYGGFAAIPLLLFELHLLWLVVLYGSELCYTLQNINTFYYKSDVDNISRRYKDFVIVVVLRMFIKAFENGEGPVSENDIAKSMQLPIRLVDKSVMKLEKVGILTPTLADKHSQKWQIGIPTEKLTLGFLYDKLNNSGSEEFGLKDRDEFKEAWKSLNEAYQQIKDKADSMKISDL